MVVLLRAGRPELKVLCLSGATACYPGRLGRKPSGLRCPTHYGGLLQPPGGTLLLCPFRHPGVTTSSGDPCVPRSSRGCTTRPPSTTSRTCGTMASAAGPCCTSLRSSMWPHSSRRRQGRPWHRRKCSHCLRRRRRRRRRRRLPGPGSRCQSGPAPAWTCTWDDASVWSCECCFFLSGRVLCSGGG